MPLAQVVAPELLPDELAQRRRVVGINRVRQVMRVDFPRVRLDDSLYEVQQRMAENGIDAVPVFDGERFLGLLTRRDLTEVYQLLSVSPELLRRREVA